MHFRSAGGRPAGALIGLYPSYVTIADFRPAIEPAKTAAICGALLRNILCRYQLYYRPSQRPILPPIRELYDQAAALEPLFPSDTRALRFATASRLSAAVNLVAQVGDFTTPRDSHLQPLELPHAIMLRR